MRAGRIAWRIAELAATMLAVSAIVYAVLEIDAADVAVKVLGPYTTLAQRQLWLHENGYDAPFVWRYLVWLGHFAIGEWGQSVHYRAPVATLLRERLAMTALLAGVTLAITVPLSFALGIAAGAREGSLADRIVSVFCVLTTSIPEYASAAFLSGVFVFWLGWLPGASTMISGFAPQELVLPVSVLVLFATGYLARVTRAAMVETMAAPYIRTALMKGASPTRIVFGHALRNALVAPVTVVMLYVPWLLSGVIVVEVFFSYPGFGSLLYEAAMNSDITLIEGCAMISVVVVVVTQLISEALYAVLNPRLKRTRSRVSKQPVGQIASVVE